MGCHYFSQEKNNQEKKNIIYCTQKKYQCQGFHFAPEKLKALKLDEDITEGLGTFVSCVIAYTFTGMSVLPLSVSKSHIMQVILL